ncbi:DNA binding domain-containing protein, excisionase family [Lutibacter oricola]|uniref:DNA binding domain-containing protein, excisionase family n=1 Tax=Lutibacter oricola TaxID=762486 RepID=A0A1H3CPL8_9FLAO|nr:helix-turn-helix domain-containing protein [Lutibacter oricola]SDX55514.1 DNA binding domain-containing protein, excisionase family [Lutibacter oricola]
MENPFEIIIEKLTAIETRISSIENRLLISNAVLDLEVMSLNQLCNHYDLTKSFVYKKTHNREIPHYKKGKRLVFKKDEIDAWLLKNKVKTMADLQREATKYSISKIK